MQSATGRPRLLVLPWFLALVLVAWPSSGYAQDATITGTVTDSTGAVLPGVTVVAVNEATGNMLEAVTDERGGFRMPARIGNWRLTASLGGFADATRSLPLAVGQTVVVNLQMAAAGLA